MIDPDGNGPSAAFGPRDFPLLLGGGLVLYFVLSSIGRSLNGPAYLIAFALIWTFLLLLHIGLRRVWRDSFAMSAVAAVILAGVAWSRYRWGVQQGMQRWAFLVIMTTLGCASFFLRASQLQGGDGSDTSSWSSGCGTASDGGGGGGCGGGCGGGGCGGCGGG